jgi:hypothetical protein
LSSIGADPCLPSSTLFRFYTAGIATDQYLL